VTNGKGDDNDAERRAKASEQGRKEKSVLQAKLTRLAIQIGYGGRFY